MNREFERSLQISLILLDLVILNIVYFLAQMFSKESVAGSYYDAYVKYWAISDLMWIVPSFLLRTYAEKIILDFITIERFSKEFLQIPAAFKRKRIFCENLALHFVVKKSG